MTMAVFLYSLLFNAQVGINNNSPMATLDITAKTTDGSKPEGLIAPRLTGDQIQAGDAQYGTAQKGAIIYITSIPTSPSIKTANITAEGYYYFDGTAWAKLNNPVNIYTSDGIIAGSSTRTVTTTGNYVNFVNGSNSVGIGTAGTQGILSVNGSSRGALQLNGGSGQVNVFVDDASAAQIVSTGNSTPMNIGSLNAAPVNIETNGVNRVTVTPAGNVGIGTETPTSNLEINSNIVDKSGLRISKLNTSSVPTPNAVGLGIDSNGDVVVVGGATQVARIVFNSVSTNTSNILLPAYNSISFNTIIGSSITNGATSFTLPAGIYKITINVGGTFSSAQASNYFDAQVWINNSNYQTVAAYSTAGSNGGIASGSCIFKLTGTSTIEMKSFAQVGTSNGFTVNSSTSVALIERLN